MEVTLLGTGAPWAAQRATLGMWITAPGCAPLLLDTCGGMELARQLRRAGLDRERVENVLVTHQHLDHAGGIPTLYLGLDRFTVFATVETHEGVAALMRATYPEMASKPGVANVVVEPNAPREIAGFVVELFPVVHRVPTVAIRVSHGAKTLAFSADSLPCEALVACARDADLFICDGFVAESDGAPMIALARELMHPTAREAAEMATRAGAGVLALVHLLRLSDPARILEEASATFRGPGAVPDDCQTYEL
jgi:ribonuclease BN (tRNA processing enzyme)